jgi:hypothetical protein
LGIVDDIDLVTQPTKENLAQSERFKQLNRIDSFMIPEDEESTFSARNFFLAA